MGLVSCSHHEVEEPSGEKEAMAVGFSASLADGAGTSRAVTRADAPAPGDGELTTALLRATGFGVYCWYTGTTDIVFSQTGTSPCQEWTPAKHISTYLGDNGYMLMRNQKVTWTATPTESEPDKGYWTYTPYKYWPLRSDEKLTFRAYAPYVPYNLLTDDKGMPQLPVIVTADDYHNGTQHDPLWGTGRLVQGTDDTTPGEYFPEPAPSDADQSKSIRYGQHYDNITYPMSGDKRKESDARDGIIDWYFHHGMSRIMFSCSVIADPGCDKVVIRGISITPLYDQGLLSLSSPTASSSEKPVWTECSPTDSDNPKGITVTLKEKDETHIQAYTPTDFANSPGDSNDPSYQAEPFAIPATPLDTDNSTRTPYYPLLSKGLLIIPRDFSSSEMTVTITYSIDNDSDLLEATGTIRQNFLGNTSYTLELCLTPSTRGLQITIVHTAFTAWTDIIAGETEVYNW